MHQRDRAVGERQTSLGGADHHALPRGGVARFGVGRLQMLADQLHRRQRQRVGERVRPLRHIGFQGMGKTVDASIGGGARRDRERQFVVHDRRQRQAAEPGDQHFLVAFVVGYDGETGTLAAGAGGGGNGDDGHFPQVRRERHLVVPHLAAALRENGHRLGGVDGGATAEPDQAVVMAGVHRRDTPVDDGVVRLRHGVAKDPRRNASSLQRIEHRSHQSQLHHHRIGDDQRAGEPEFGQHIGDLFHRTAGNQQHAGGGDVGVDGSHGWFAPGCWTLFTPGWGSRHGAVFGAGLGFDFMDFPS